MSAGAAIILVGGLGAAAFLYYRSQQQQAAALAAAQAALGPGLLQKTENTVKTIFSPTTGRAVQAAATAAVKQPFQIFGSVAGGVAHTATSLVGSIRSIF